MNYKSVLSKGNTHRLSDLEILKLQKCLVQCAQEVIEACEKYNIHLILQGGSLLGYVRHKGFIPWDDDLDFGLLREDYEKFIDIFDRELSDRYILRVPKKGRKATNRFMQLFRKNTLYDDGHIESADRPQNIYIDIFPLDFAPNNALLRNIKGTIANGLMGIAGAVDTYTHRNKTLKQISCSTLDGAIQYNIRIIIGKCFSFISLDRWFRYVDCFISSKKRTRYLTSATGRKHYLGEIIETSSVLPFSRVNFEGLVVYAPKNPDIYLNNLYGNYMKIPKAEDREHHYILTFKTLEDMQNDE